MKYNAVYHVLRLGYDVLLSDVEAVWCMNLKRRFEGLINTHRETDIFVQLVVETDKIGPELFYVVSTARSIKLFKGIIDELASLKTEKEGIGRIKSEMLDRDVLNMFHIHGCTDNEYFTATKKGTGKGVSGINDMIINKSDGYPKRNCSQKWDLELA